MRLRAPYALTAALLAVPGVPARALSCPMVVPHPGNVQVSLPRESPVAAELDLRSADLASGPTVVLVVVHVRDLGAPDPATRLGALWELQFSVAGTTYVAQAHRNESGTYYGSLNRSGVPFGGVPLTPDTDHDTLTWAIPRSWVPELATPGQEFRVTNATTYVTGTPFSQVAVVRVTANVRYRDQARACVKAF